MRNVPEASSSAAATSHVPRLLQVGVPPAFRQTLLNGEDINEVTVDRLQELLIAGCFTSMELTKHCIERIQSVSRAGSGNIV